jgi:hypothetical protein
MTGLRGAASALLPLVLSACATTQPGGPPPLAGCWYFERDAAAERLQLPWGVRLLEDTLTGWPALQQRPGVRRALTLLRPGEEEPFPFGYWLPLGSDSVEIGYPAGGGLLLELAVSAERLSGGALELGDAQPPPAGPRVRPRHPVSLAWAACPP